MKKPAGMEENSSVPTGFFVRYSSLAAESIEDVIRDNRMFAERAFYCIANGACEL